MKVSLRLMALLLLGFMAFAYAVPDKASKEDSLAVEQSQDESPSQSAVSSSEDAIGDLLLQAVSLLGVAYRFGGASPASGLDCSGFIQYVFKKSLKLTLPRTATEMARLGRPVERQDLVPGDLVFFNTRGFIFSHVGIYMGNGKFIHAPRTGKHVEVSNLTQRYWLARYNGARRFDRYGNTELAGREDEALAMTQTSAEEVPNPRLVKRLHCLSHAKSRKCRIATASKKNNTLKRSRSHRATESRHVRQGKGSKKSGKKSKSRR
jgi:hypothetical protein